MENPPPAYGSTQPGQPPPPVPSEPPPTYELPKEGPYAPPPSGYNMPPGSQEPYNPAGHQDQPYYPAQNQPIPVQQQPAYGATVHQTVIVRDVGYGPQPRTIDCPNCHAMVTTQTSYSSGGLTWLSSGLICLIGCWLGCCLIPFCIPELQDVEHKCPNCQHHIGTFRRI